MKKMAKRGTKNSPNDYSMLIDNLIKLEATTPGSSGKRLTRKRVKEHNDSVTDASMIIEVKEIDVSEFLRTTRKMKREARLLEQSRRDANNNRSKNSTISATTPQFDSAANKTFTIDRDYTTPEFEAPVLEAMRKDIYDELSRSVTLRKGTKVTKNDDGTPVAVKTRTLTTFNPHSPTNSSPKARPRRLGTFNKNHDESRNSLQLRQPVPRVTFDSLNTDDETDDSEDDEDAMLKYPAWAKNYKKFAKVQEKIDQHLFDTLFMSDQVKTFKPSELFPTTNPKLLKRRRSSLI